MIMQSEYYSFGGFVLRIEGNIKWQEDNFTKPFRMADLPAEHTICVTFADAEMAAPAGIAKQDNIYRWREGEKLCLLHDHGDGFSALSMQKGCITELRLSAKYKDNLSVKTILESAGIFDILAEHGMLILHSAYITTQAGEALLFCGPCGAGKSTQAELWRQYAKARVINGDRTLVQPGSRMVHGIFYSGTSGICANVSAPLKAVILPIKAAENRIYPIKAKEAFMRLLNQCSYYTWAKDSLNRMTELVALLVNNVPVYCMECCKDESAVRALQAYLRSIDNGSI